MKRIGILTYHKSNNYGAFMQCYSLATKLKKLFPDECIEVVDYLSKEVYSLYHPSIRSFSYMIFHAHGVRRKLRYTKMLLSYMKVSALHKKVNVESAYFDEAQQKLPLSHKQIISDNYLEIVDYLNDNYDILIVGSDAVWNWQIRPFPNVYFLGCRIKTRKLSYAASSYGQPFRYLTEDIKEEIKRSWCTFDYIGVRDIPTEHFVSSLLPDITPLHNCDPTVFLDLSKLPVDRDKVLAKLKKAGYDSNKKTIGLMAQPWLAKFVRSQLGADYQIVSIFKHSEWADVNLMDINPFEWAICFSFFDITITHYFHGNLLSLKNETPTIVIEQKSSYNQQYDSKIRDFMKRIKLIDNCFYFDELFGDYSLKNKVEACIINKSIIRQINSGMEEESNSFDSFCNALTKILQNYP